MPEPTAKNSTIKVVRTRRCCAYVSMACAMSLGTTRFRLLPAIVIATSVAMSALYGFNKPTRLGGLPAHAFVPTFDISRP